MWDSSVSQLLELALLKGDLRAAATFKEVLDGDYFRAYQITNRARNARCEKLLFTRLGSS